MSNVKERVAYLHGLTKGLNVDDRTPEGKAILNIIDVLEDIADDVRHVHAQQQELETYVETLDEDLNDLEEDFYEEFDSYADDDFVEIQCPSCHEEVSFESELLADKDDIEVTCPHCGSVVYDNFSNRSHGHHGHHEYHEYHPDAYQYGERPGN